MAYGHTPRYPRTWQHRQFTTVPQSVVHWHDAHGYALRGLVGSVEASRFHQLFASLDRWHRPAGSDRTRGAYLGFFSARLASQPGLRSLRESESGRYFDGSWRDAGSGPMRRGPTQTARVDYGLVSVFCRVSGCIDLLEFSDAIRSPYPRKLLLDLQPPESSAQRV